MNVCGLAIPDRPLLDVNVHGRSCILSNDNAEREPDGKWPQGSVGLHATVMAPYDPTYQSHLPLYTNAGAALQLQAPSRV